AAIPNRRVEVRHQTIAELEVLPDDRLDFLVVQLVRIGAPVCLYRPAVAAVPTPRQSQMPVAAVRAEQRIERAELEPAHMQLAGVVGRRDEPADIGSPIRQSR